MSPHHRAVLRSRRLGAGPWWVELGRAAAALGCIVAWGAAAWVFYVVILQR